MSRGMSWLLLLLTLGTFASGVGVVYAKYLSRKHFAELQQLRAERDEADIRWGRLQLEESTLAAYSRVESKSRGVLDMHIPRDGEVMVLRER